MMHLVLLKDILDLLHVIVGEHKTNVKLAGIGKLVEGSIARVDGVLADHVLDHGVLTHDDLSLGRLAKLRTHNVHLLRANVVRRHHKHLIHSSEREAA
jgi:hypothetical protein